MLKLIYDCGMVTLNSNRLDLEILIKTVSKAEEFAIESMRADAHVHNISKRKITSISAASKNQKRCMDLVRRTYLLNTIFFDLCRELGEAIRSLVIGNYSSVSRSLRWIIESAVFLTDMQGDYGTASEVYEHFTTFHHPSMDNKEYSYQCRHVSDLNYDLLEDRLSLKEKWKKYGINDILGDNVILQVEGPYKKSKGHSLKSEIQKLYKELSGFDHISIESLQEIDKTLRTDYAIYLDYVYDREKYSYQFMNLWKVVDLVTSIVVLAGTKFYEYSTTFEYLDKMQKYYKNSHTKKMINYIEYKKIHDKLPLFSLML
jgi:hypothetical protein